MGSTIDTNSQSFYVYVYIDPRSLEPFYYGKGQGSRQFAHLSDTQESQKTERIKQIRAEGQEPMVRVVATGLTEEQALLVEKTLIWNSRGLTNLATGHFGNKFRPPNTFHRRLPGFDYRNQLQYFNVGDGEHRRWEDNVEYSYLGAGQGKRFRDEIKGLHRGDIVIARLNGAGYVGVGRIMSEATPARDFRVSLFANAQHARGKLLINIGLSTAVDDMVDDEIRCEYMVATKWIKVRPRNEAFWKKNARLFAPRGLTRATLSKQPKTIAFVEERFGVNLETLADDPESENL
jgi:hypothetical protein